MLHGGHPIVDGAAPLDFSRTRRTGPRLTSNSSNVRPQGYFCQAAFDVDAPRLQNTALNKNIQTKTTFIKSRVFKNRWKMDLNLSPCAGCHAEFVSRSKVGPKPTQNQILTFFLKILFIRRRHRLEALLISSQGRRLNWRRGSMVGRPWGRSSWGTLQGRPWPPPAKNRS